MIKNIVDELGGVAETARKLDVSQPAVSQWIKHNRIPPARAVQIEVLTKGKYKAAQMLQGVGDDGR